ncbi:putative knottin, scorpion toxin-like superfamily [Helianthus debilis subsp. tardiflorus]
MGKRLFFFMFVLVLFCSEKRMVKVTKAKMCGTPGTDPFLCSDDNACNKICQLKKFNSGHCEEGTTCMCYNKC